MRQHRVKTAVLMRLRNTAALTSPDLGNDKLASGGCFKPEHIHSGFAGKTGKRRMLQIQHTDATLTCRRYLRAPSSDSIFSTGPSMERRFFSAAKASSVACSVSLTSLSVSAEHMNILW
jgi:hypothetical protein